MSEGTNEGLSIRCPECQKRLKVPPKMAGKRVPCPSCKAMLNLPTFEPSEPNQAKVVQPISLDSDLDDIGFKLADIAPKSSANKSFAEEHLGVDINDLKEKEYSYPCKVCGTMMYAKPSDIGSMVHCPDCYSEYSVPGPPKQKAQARDPDLNKIAAVALAPVKANRPRSQEMGRSTAEDYLAKAEKEVDEGDQEDREQLYDFDTSGWMKRTFAFLGDPSLIVIALTTGFFLGGAMIGASVVGDMAAAWKTDNPDSARSYGFMTVLVLMGVPLLSITLANGIAVLEASGNKLKRIASWPIFNPTEAMSEIIVAIAAFVASVLPGGAASWAGSWIGLTADIGMGVVLLIAVALYPVVLLGMLDNQSVTEPYSSAVIGSMREKSDAWGAMYLLTGLAIGLVFILYLVAATGTRVPKFVLGLSLPIIIFFVFHQYGVLASRIADLTNLAFETEENEVTEDKKGSEEEPL